LQQDPNALALGPLADALKAKEAPASELDDVALLDLTAPSMMQQACLLPALELFDLASGDVTGALVAEQPDHATGAVDGPPAGGIRLRLQE
jgi:hypothetical protein